MHPADQQAIAKELEQLRAEEKRLMALLADKGAGPQNVGPGVLNAMLMLKGNQAGAAMA